jgi:branched-chain amino acid transport system ATP-binding protein
VRPLLQTRNLQAGYQGRAVVQGANLVVHPGEVVCLLGPNGAGKTTTLLTIAGELAPVDGLVMLSNVPTFTPMYQRVRDGGIGLVTEERLVFTKMSTRDNLRIGGGSVEAALALFPELESRLSVRGGMLSGGEQQMLALARALSRKPALLLADELSLGLAPLIVDRLLSAVRTAADEQGTGALIVEQHARKALKYADRMYLMARGQILLELPAAEAIAGSTRSRRPTSAAPPRPRKTTSSASAGRTSEAVATSASARTGADQDDREARVHQEGRR